MAEDRKATAARRDDASKTDAAANKNEVVVVSDRSQELIDASRKTLKEEAEGKEGVSGPADNFTGDASENPAHDHVYSADPYKKAFPPGPDDPSKL